MLPGSLAEGHYAHQRPAGTAPGRGTTSARDLSEERLGQGQHALFDGLGPLAPARTVDRQARTPHKSADAPRVTAVRLVHGTATEHCAALNGWFDDPVGVEPTPKASTLPVPVFGSGRAISAFQIETALNSELDACHAACIV
jgi:hypothetical protein